MCEKKFVWGSENNFFYPLTNTKKNSIWHRGLKGEKGRSLSWILKKMREFWEMIFDAGVEARGFKF